MIVRMMIIIAILATIKGDEKRDLRKEKKDGSALVLVVYPFC